MPTKRTRRKFERCTIDKRVLEKLLSGFQSPRPRYPADEFDRRMLGEGWDAWGEELTAFWVFGPDAAPEIAAVYGDRRSSVREIGPGTRPWGWWAFPETKIRRVVSGTPDPRDGLPYGAFSGNGFTPASDVKEYLFGLPRHCWHKEEVVYETQADYLRRLDLLLPGEAELLNQQRPD
jgi:hypothetical protein